MIGDTSVLVSGLVLLSLWEEAREDGIGAGRGIQTSTGIKARAARPSRDDPSSLGSCPPHLLYSDGPGQQCLLAWSSRGLCMSPGLWASTLLSISTEDALPGRQAQGTLYVTPRYVVQCMCISLVAPGM